MRVSQNSAAMSAANILSGTITLVRQTVASGSHTCHLVSAIEVFLCSLVLAARSAPKEGRSKRHGLRRFAGSLPRTKTVGASIGWQARASWSNCREGREESITRYSPLSAALFPSSSYFPELLRLKMRWIHGAY